MSEIKRYFAWCIKGIRRRIKNLKPVQKKMLTFSLIALILGCLLGNGIGRAVESKKSQKKMKEAVAEIVQKSDDEIGLLKRQLYDLQEELNDHSVEIPWNLALVNHKHPMEDEYAPELKELQAGYSVDTRIAGAVRKMLSDAEKDGMNIKIASAYRSVERQKKVFGDSMKDRVKDGMSYWEAYEETVQNVALPGMSEHALGLALDLVSNQYSELDERQETTAEAKWLKENCYKYGFILRYPPSKTDITGIIYEPWHYRYVGEEHAKKIMELGITLEEYLQKYYQPTEGEK